jgi:hypothetical protein
MFRHALLALAALAMVGCEAGAKFDPMGANKGEPAQLAAYAATAKYPGDVQPIDGPPVAVLNRDGEIRLINFSKEPVRDVKVWVNGLFVHHVDLLPAMGNLTLSKAVFYDGTGRPLSKGETGPVRVTLQQGNTLYSTLGPVNDER